MTHEQKPESAEFRTRAEETAEYTCGMSAEFVSSVQHIHPDQDYPSLQAVAIYRHGYDLGAAEQRRKDAEGAEPFAWGVTLDIEMGYPFLAHKTPISPIPARNVPLYDRPANVAALEARVKELEGYEKDAARFRWLLENVGLYYGIPGFAGTLGRTPKNRVEALLQAIDANIERAAAAIREGEQA